MTAFTAGVLTGATTTVLAATVALAVILDRQAAASYTRATS